MRLLIITLLFSFTCQAQIINASGNYRVTNAEPPPPSCSVFIFDDTLSTETSQTAFSFRLLSSTVSTDSCIKVRRSSDNSEQVIGFSGCTVDTATLKTFVGANSAYIVEWYDQSGNRRTASQSTAGKQPRIVNAGVVERDNDNVAARFLGAGYVLETASYTAYPDSIIFNSVAKVTTNVTYNTVGTKTQTYLAKPIDQYNNVFFSSNGASYSTYNLNETFNSASASAAWTFKITYPGGTGKATAYKNTTSITTGGSQNVTLYEDVSCPLYIGSRADGATGLNGYITESLTFSAISETEVQTLISNQVTFYGL